MCPSGQTSPSPLAAPHLQMGDLCDHTVHRQVARDRACSEPVPQVEKGADSALSLLRSGLSLLLDIKCLLKAIAVLVMTLQGLYLYLLMSHDRSAYND